MSKNIEKLKQMNYDDIAKCIVDYSDCNKPCDKCELTKYGIDSFCNISLTGENIQKWLEEE